MKTILLNQEISNYAIDENGHVFNTITNTELNGSITLSGYKYFRLCHKGKQFRFYAHRLVAEYYLPNDKSLQVVNHKNGNKLDNRIENLEWVSHSENNIHANKTGLRKPNKGPRQYFNMNLHSYQGEKWRPVSGYENYFVSSYGRICSQKRSQSILLKPVLTNGYYKVRLSKNGKVKDEMVAYLVYFNFHQEQKKENYIIDHIDGDKTNNNIDNLRYISYQDNTLAAYYLQHLQSNIRPVICYKDGKQIGVYPSCREAATQLNCDASAISKCCRGRYKSHHGYTFQYR